MQETFNVSVFLSESTSKFPESPFGDRTFEFTTLEFSLEEFLHALQTNFVLNRNYSFGKRPKRLRRTKSDLKKFLNEKTNFIILDFDEVKSEHSKDKIFEYFKIRDYYCGFIPSRSYDGIGNFNLKGVMKVNALNNRQSIRAILEEISKDLFEYGHLDFSSINEGSFQAPARSNEILFVHYGETVPKKYLKNEEVKFSLFDDEIKQICFSHFNQLGFSVVKYVEDKKLYVFRHPNEKTPNGYFAFENTPWILRHFDETKNISIFSEVYKKEKFKNWFNKEKERSLVGNFTRSLSGNGVAQVNQRYLSPDIDIQWKDVLKIYSAMGTGKSNIIGKIVDECRSKGSKVLFITNRISVAKDISKKYGIKNYLKDEYFPGDDYIVQFDSLWKLSLKDFDTIIIDEFMSVLLHSRNDLGDKSLLNKIKLFYGIKNKRLVIADAFFFGFEDVFLPQRDIFLLENLFRENSGLERFTNKERLIQEILNKSGNGKHVSVSCTSKITAEIVNLLCEEKGLKTMLLTSETSDDDKDDIYKIFEKEKHNYWDVLIYTPTLTVGVSNVNESDYHFHIDESQSADVISSLQMMRRNRKAKHISFYVKERFRYLETDLEKIKTRVIEDLRTYFKSETSFYVDFDEEGDMKLSEFGEFMLKIETLYNMLEFSHASAFENLLKKQFSSAILLNEEKSSLDLTAIRKRIKEKKKQELLEQLRTLEDLTTKNSLREKKAHIETYFKNAKRILERDIQDSGYFNKLMNLRFFMKTNTSKLDYLISEALKQNVFDKRRVEMLKHYLVLKKGNFVLKDKYTPKEIKVLDNQYPFIKKVLRKLGYTIIGGVYILDKRIKEDIKGAK
jgi:KaiC/GvpD/RAD55 family RecA-like ATPase